MKKYFLITLMTGLITQVNLAHAQYAEPQKGPNMFRGPSLHLGGGIRMKKSPDEDTIEYGIASLKISPFSVMFGSTYLSLLSPGLNYADRDQRFVLSITPIMLNHISGLGFGVDMYRMRSDRPGGIWGFSLNLDIPQVISFASGMMAK